jgi:predicted membrane-bound dolichyl-phosphate-mannose-protein mannosyltransferase
VAKAVLLSVIIAMIAIPVLAARAKSARRGLQWTIVGIVLFNLFYLFAIRFIYPHL